MNTKWYKIIKNKTNLTYPVKIVLIGVGIVTFSVLSLLYESEHKKEVVPQTQPTLTPTPTLTPSQKEIEKPLDTNNWQLYDKYGITFSHPPNWRVVYLGETFGNYRTWSFDAIVDNESSPVLFIQRTRRYVSLPGFNDTLTGYLIEQVGQEKGNLWQEFTFKGRRAVRITTDKPQEWSSDNIIVSIPEELGVLSIGFSGDQENFTQSVKDYFEPFLQSLEIKLDAWPEPGTYLSLSPTSQLDTSFWKLYQGGDFSLRYPESWWVEKRNIEGKSTVVLSKFGGERLSTDKELPQIFIGSGLIFSTSGAICANEPYCKEIGEAEIRTKGNNYFASILEKKITFSDEENKYEGDPSYYVFAVNLNRIPSGPTITALYKTVGEGQEIVNILSTTSTDF